MSKRTAYDPIAYEGYGFPFVISLRYGAAITTTTNVNRTYLPAKMSQARNGAAFTATDIVVSTETVGTQTTLDKIKVVHIDSSGNVIATIADVSIGNATKHALVDLRDSRGKGYVIRPGEGIRLDGTVGSGGTAASNSVVQIWGEAYGMKG